mmetsp:Transcript_18710/g.28682  ORF Transcript_18710/g.28682 Transcript_18710/m.28682 type:complete len:82 (+) Transcript_18710:1927-2172(+)
MFVSCSDDETLKVWGVQNLVDIEIFIPKARKKNKLPYKVIDTLNEGRSLPSGRNEGHGATDSSFQQSDADSNPFSRRRRAS